MTPAEARHWLNLSVSDTFTGFIDAPIRVDLLPETILRFYQYDMLVEAARLMRLGVRRILLVLPTGAGKTVMASAMIQSAMQQSMAAQFMVHRRELIEQTSETFTRMNLPHGFIAAGYPMDFANLVTLAGVQTLVRRLDLVLPPRLAVVDEAHHATAASWEAVLSEYQDKDCFTVGLTATPQRLDGKGLDQHFDVMIIGPSPSSLIEWGYLSSFTYYAPGEPDLTSVHKTAGDFNRGELGEVMNKPKLIGDMVEHYAKHAHQMKGIIFAASVEHSINIAREFSGNGIPTLHVDGQMAKNDRRYRMDAFKAGDVRLMTNVDLFGEGLDVPGIGYVGLGRPSHSLAMVKQQWGRGLRPIYDEGFDISTDQGRLLAIQFGPKPQAVFCDHAGNALRHSCLPDDDHAWSLQGRAARIASGSAPSDSTPVHQCMECYRVVPSIIRICPGCDTPFPVQQRQLKSEVGQLTKLERMQAKEDARVKRKIEERRCKSYEDFKQLAFERGYSNPAGWAKVQSKLRNGGRIS